METSTLLCECVTTHLLYREVYIRSDLSLNPTLLNIDPTELTNCWGFDNIQPDNLHWTPDVIFGMMQGCNDGYTPPREITNWVKWVMYTHEPIWNKRLRCDTTRLNNLLVVYYLMVSNNLKLGDELPVAHKTGYSRWRWMEPDVIYAKLIFRFKRHKKTYPRLQASLEQQLGTHATVIKNKFSLAYRIQKYF